MDRSLRDQLWRRRHWVFDLDGTLTRAVHDFDDIRARLGLPAGRPILEALAELPEARAESLARQLYDMELALARDAAPQPGAAELLAELGARDCRLGILTRNSRRLADVTLEACGLSQYFTAEDIVGRECCAPKPDPSGIRMLLRRWSADAGDSVMVGDYLFDLQAGRGAGSLTVHFDIRAEFPWPEHSDIGVSDLAELIPGGSVP